MALYPWQTASSSAGDNDELPMPPKVLPPSSYNKKKQQQIKLVEPVKAGMTPAAPPAYTPNPSGGFGAAGPPPVFGNPGQSSGIFNAGGLTPTPYTKMDDGGMAGSIKEALDRMLAGGTRYSPEVVEAMKGQLLTATRGQQKAAEDAIREQGSEMGVSGARSGQVQKELAGAATSAASGYSAGVLDIAKEKAIADFDDRLAAIDRGQKYVNDLRQYELGADMAQVE